MVPGCSSPPVSRRSRLWWWAAGSINPSSAEENNYLWIQATVYPLERFPTIIFYAIKLIVRRMRLINDMAIFLLGPPTHSILKAITGVAGRY